MQKTGKSRRDGVIAAMAALAINAWLAWALQGLLSRDRPVTDAPEMQLVLIAAAPRPQAAILPVSTALPQTTAPRAADPHPTPVDARRIAAPPTAVTAEEVVPSRPMSAVYLQQARKWDAQNPTATDPADRFANRPVALAQQTPSRFRIADPVSMASALAKVGKLFGGNDYTTDDCALIRGRLVSLVTGGDTQSVQQDLDYQRRHCRP